MIPLQFVLFWCGAKLSYLRYLTFKSLRHFHPDSKIELYVAEEYNANIHKWGSEKQDFEIKDENSKDYIDELPKLGIVVNRVKCIGSPEYCAILQADLFRWIWMRDGKGGFYLDTDQIITKSFSGLNLDNEFIYSRYMEPQCGDYLPVGVLGMEGGSKIADIVLDTIAKCYSANNYNSSGPFAMREAIKKINLARSFNTPSYYFYPVHSSMNVNKIYDGSFSLDDRSFALHWYGGHRLSQEFNSKYSEEFAKSSKDTISRFVRENKIN